MIQSLDKRAIKAVQRAQTRAEQHVRTVADKEIMKTYDISKKNLRSDKNLRRARQNTALGSMSMLRFSGNKIPLYRYNGTWPKEVMTKPDLVEVTTKYGRTLVHPGVTAKAHQKKGASSEKWKNAFVQTMPNPGKTHTGIFIRNGKKTSYGGDAIEEVMGSSYAQMLGGEEVLKKIEEGAQEVFQKRVVHELAWELSKK